MSFRRCASRRPTATAFRAALPRCWRRCARCVPTSSCCTIRSGRRAASRAPRARSGRPSSPCITARSRSMPPACRAPTACGSRAARLDAPRLPRRRRRHLRRRHARGLRPRRRDRAALRPRSSVRAAARRATRGPRALRRRLGREKGVVELLHAAARSREPWQLRLVGRGPIEQRLRRLADSLGLGDRVRWLPYIADRAELARAYAAARVVVMPGAHETFGLVGFEAAASGAAVVTCSTAPSAARMRLIVQTYEPGDVDGLLTAIEARAPIGPRPRRGGGARRPLDVGGSVRGRDGPAAAPRSTAAAGRAAEHDRPRGARRRGRRPRAHDAARLRAAAEAVLRGNWREGTRADGVPYAFTCPATPRYRHMWHWDSCFHAIAWRLIDPARARAELRTVLRSGRPDGFLPHTVFWDAPAGWRRAPLYATRGLLGDRHTETIGPPLLAFAWELVADASPDDPRVSRRGAARARLPPALARTRARPRRRRAAVDHRPGRVGPRRRAEVRAGVRAHDARSCRLRAADRARPARALGLAHAARALRPQRRGRLGERRLRAVAARDGAAQRRSRRGRRGRRASSRRCSTAASTSAAACSSTSPAATSGRCGSRRGRRCRRSCCPGCRGTCAGGSSRSTCSTSAATSRRSGSRR